jgi:hypothetical protein
MREEDENIMRTLREVILSVQKLPSVWLFLPKEETWSLDSRALVAAMEEVPPEDEDLEEAGYPEAAKINNLMAALHIRGVEEVVFNARAQKPDATPEELFEAFLYYYDFDAFIDFTARKRTGA